MPVTGEPPHSANSVYGNAVVGIIVTESETASYQSRVNLGFEASNVLSGNGGNGIAVVGSNDNVIAMNQIGTDVSGSNAVPNMQNGVVLTRAASGNVIGGTATANNDPTAGVFARPPLGNLISGNRINGVSIVAGATDNILAGNFIGTTASGNARSATPATVSPSRPPTATRCSARRSSRAPLSSTTCSPATVAMACGSPMPMTPPCRPTSWARPPTTLPPSPTAAAASSSAAPLQMPSWAA